MSKIAQIKITLEHVRPPTWRRVLIDTASTLADLHQVVQGVMGWTNTHVHAFNILDEFYEPDPSISESPGEVKDEHQFTLKKVLSLGVREFEYVYDFGDDWVHKIEIEKVLDADPSVGYPICVKGKRAGPPEDVGGPWEYMDMVKVLMGPNTSQRRDFLDWLGDRPFDAEDFNLEDSNMGLSAIQPGTTNARYSFV